MKKDLDGSTTVTVGFLVPIPSHQGLNRQGRTRSGQGNELQQQISNDDLVEVKEGFGQRSGEQGTVVKVVQDQVSVKFNDGSVVDLPKNDLCRIRPKKASVGYNAKIRMGRATVHSRSKMPCCDCVIL